MNCKSEKMAPLEEGNSGYEERNDLVVDTFVSKAPRLFLRGLTSSEASTPDLMNRNI